MLYTKKYWHGLLCSIQDAYPVACMAIVKSFFYLILLQLLMLRPYETSEGEGKRKRRKREERVEEREKKEERGEKKEEIENGRDGEKRGGDKRERGEGEIWLYRPLTLLGARTCYKK